MKKAKVKHGVIQHVWPRVKVLPDGREVIKALPECYTVGHHPYIIDVRDDVKPGWVWDGEKFGPRKKEPPTKRREWMIDALCARLGINYDELLAEAKQLKLLAKKDT